MLLMWSNTNFRQILGLFGKLSLQMTKKSQDQGLDLPKSMKTLLSDFVLNYVQSTSIRLNLKGQYFKCFSQKTVKSVNK